MNFAQVAMLLLYMKLNLKQILVYCSLLAAMFHVYLYNVFSLLINSICLSLCSFHTFYLFHILFIYTTLSLPWITTKLDVLWWRRGCKLTNKNVDNIYFYVLTGNLWYVVWIAKLHIHVSLPYSYGLLNKLFNGKVSKDCANKNFCKADFKWTPGQ